MESVVLLRKIKLNIQHAMNLLPIDWCVYYPGRLQYIFFIVCAFTFTIFMLHMSYSPTIGREYFPVESDDSMVYLLKAVQMDSCYRQECASFADLRNQVFLPDQGEGLHKERFVLASALLQYTHLHAALVWTVKAATGLAWTDAFNVVSVLGALLIIVGLSFWLFGLVGPMAAGLSLILLAALDSILPAHALSMVTPSNMAMGAAMLSWGFLIQRQGELGWWLIVMILVQMAFHPLGEGYAGVTLGAFLVLRGWPLHRRDLIVFVTGLALIVLFHELPHFVKRPVIGLSGHFESSSATFNDWWINVDILFRLAREWMIPLGIGKWTAMIAVGVTLLLQFGLSRLAYAVFLLFVSGLCSVAFFYTTGATSHDVLARYWSAFIVLPTAAISCLLLLVPGYILNARKGMTGKGAIIVVYVPLLLFSISLWIPVARLSASTPAITQKRVEHMAQRYNYPFDATQPLLLHDSEAPCDRVLYFHSGMVKDAYFTEGAMGCGALFASYLTDSETGPRLIPWLEQVTHVVWWNQVHSRPRPISIREGKIEVWLSPQKKYVNLRLYLENSTRNEVNVMIREVIGETVQSHRLPPYWKGWVTGDMPAAGNYRITMDKKEGDAWLKGIRLGGSEENLLWPWDQGVELGFTDYDEKYGVRITQNRRKVHFDVEKMLEGVPLKVRIIADKGMTVLGRVR